MRLWTLHPKYLDARGLVALWREALLAQKVLRGATHGYRHHPQLRRFSETENPPAVLAAYLQAVHDEAVERAYHFDARKIGRQKSRGKIRETRGQLLYEWRHLKRKLKQRDPMRLRKLAAVTIPAPHPLFKIVAGKVRDWEKVKYQSRQAAMARQQSRQRRHPRPIPAQHLSRPQVAATSKR